MMCRHCCGAAERASDDQCRGDADDRHRWLLAEIDCRHIKSGTDPHSRTSLV
jgi:hypothetical protein